MDKDERFKHVATDPKFRRIPKSEKKVKIDKRFHGMFKDEKFKIKYTVDKRGRPVNHSSNEDLKRYYDISSESENESETENDAGKFVRAPINTSDDDLKQKKVGDKSLRDEVKKKLKDLSVDYARGEGCLNTDSSSDDYSDSEDNTDESELEHEWGELDKDAERTDEITSRLAVCNMDWDRIRAIDLMVLFNSFLSPGTHIESVTIYPSEFGKQRMQEEEINGPTELVKNKKTFDEENLEENEDGSKYHMEKLRQYQLNRLKYYYAVVVFDSPETANKIYTECDGLEYESSATKLDLRFIPDETTFDDTPKEKCDKLPELNKYQPRFFTTTALQQAKVELTWDETNPTRLEIAKKLSDGKIDDVSEADLQAYLASSSGSESEKSDIESDDNSNENPIDKYRALLNELEKKEEKNDVEMEVTWDLSAKDKTDKLVKKKLEENEEKTPFQQFLDKRKEKRKQKRLEKKDNLKNNDSSDSDMDVDMNDPYFAEEFNNPDFKTKKNKSKKHIDVETPENEQEKAKLELIMLDDDDNKKHFNMKKLDKKKKKNKNEPEIVDEFQIDVKDARFSAIFTSHHFNIDPTDSSFKKTKAMEALIEEKQKRISSKEEIDVEPPIKKHKSELNALVNSVKRKTKGLIKKK